MNLVTFTDIPPIYSLSPATLHTCLPGDYPKIIFFLFLPVYPDTMPATHDTMNNPTKVENNQEALGRDKEVGKDNSNRTHARRRHRRYDINIISEI